MDAAYLKAAHPEPFTILGKKLKPFSLGHELLFQRFKNKFSLESAEPPTEEDMLHGVWICAQEYHPRASMDGFKIPLAARIWRRILGPAYVKTAFNRFKEYIAAHTEVPEFYIKEEQESDPSGVATIQAVKISLMANMGLSELDALNTPFSLAFWNHLSWLAAQGRIQIVDEAELAKREQAKALESWVENMAKELFPNGYENGVAKMEGMNGA